MAHRIANRVAEMAENYTLVERQVHQIYSTHTSSRLTYPRPNQLPVSQTVQERKKPRKLEIRLDNVNGDPITFSAPFLDNTLRKMLSLQQRMLQTGVELAQSEEVDDKVKREQFAQSAELSKIIALICAEKARQGA